MKRTKHLFMTVVIVIGLAVSLLSIAQAQQEEREGQIQPMISPGQKDLESTLVSTGSTSYVLVPGTSVTVFIPAGTTRWVIIQFSAEARVSTAGTRMDVAWSIGGAACSPIVGIPEYGFSTDTLWEIGTIIGVKQLAGGLLGTSYTIKPCYRKAMGAAADTVTLWWRTLTVEKSTN